MFSATRISLIAACCAVLLTGAARAADATSTPPNPPANLTVSGQTGSSLTLSWTPSSSPGVTGYDTLVDGVDQGNLNLGGVNPVSERLSLHCATTYTLSLEAVDAAGNKSAPAAATSGTTLGCTDVAIVSNTASVGQAKVGQEVTFTMVATNNGPGPVEVFVHVDQALSGLRITGTNCEGGVSADGTWCEYALLVQPGETRTTRAVGVVLDTAGQYASDTACVETPDQAYDPDPNPGNDCATAGVSIGSHPGPPPTEPPQPPAPASPQSQPPGSLTAPHVGSPPGDSGIDGTSTAQIKAQLRRELAPGGTAGKVAALLAKRRYTVSLDAPAGGRILIDWSMTRPRSVLVASGRATVPRAGLVKLTIKLTAAGIRALKATGRLTLTAHGTFIPAGSAAVTATKTFTVRR